MSPKSGSAAAEELPRDEIEDAFELEIKYGNRHTIINNAPILKNGRMRNHAWACYVQLNALRVKP